MRVTEGAPAPLGATLLPGGPADALTVNIAIHTTLPDLSLVVFPPRAALVTRDPSHVIPFPGRTGLVLHVRLHAVPRDAAYGLHAPGASRLLSDPRARWLESPPAARWLRLEGEPLGPAPAPALRAFLASFPGLARLGVAHPFRPCRVAAPPAAAEFDWGPARPPRLPLADVVVYEAHVRALSPRGTFAAAAAALPYLRWLGVTALQLLPVFEFDETETGSDYELLRQDPQKRRGNCWGYAPASFFAPMNRYADEADGGPAGLKALVRACHEAGMELYLDVVYNHTAHAACPLHFLGVQADYYLGSRAGGAFTHANYSGCGHTFAANAPLGAELIVESLRWWVAEYRVDGFRLDAAGALCRDARGAPARRPRVLDAVCGDPVLRGAKMFVEGWDAGDAVGSPNFLLGRFPRGGRFCEWNPAFRDAARRFARGDPAAARAFCKALRGSPDLFGDGRGPREDRPLRAGHGVNYVACHDGLCLADVVGYRKRRNEDGYDEVSFNCGAEGETDDAGVLRLRARQARNLVFALAVARGVVMLHQGDEFGFSKRGNSNTWNDPELFAARLGERPAESTGCESLVVFVREMLRLRRELRHLRGDDFHAGLAWVDEHGRPRSSRRRDESAKGRPGFVGFWKKERGVGAGDACLYVAFNNSERDLAAKLPRDKEREIAWRKAVDTTWTDWRERDGAAEDVVESSEITVSRQSSVLYSGSWAGPSGQMGA